MDPIESSCVTIWPGSSPESDRDRDCVVVWLSGEHDIFTASVLSAALQAARAADGDVVVDLSGVEFMGAAIIGVFVHGAEELHARSRELRLRHPSRCALRIVELFGLEGLLARGPDLTRATGPVGALGTWVAVPRTDPSDRSGDGTGPASNRPSTPPPVAARCPGHHDAMTLKSSQ